MTRIDFWDAGQGGWRYEVAAERWVHEGVAIVQLVVEDTGHARRGAPPFYVGHLGRRFPSLEEAKKAIDVALAPPGRAR